MRIGEIANITGLECSTLRYYEEINLIRSIKRNEQGLRDYDEDDLAWIKFIVAMRQACVSIEDIKAFGELYYSKNENLFDRRQVAFKCKEKLLIEKEAIESGIRFLDKKIAYYTSIIDGEKEEKNGKL